MLSFLKRIFGVKPAKSTPAPYKVEKVDQFPFPKAEQAKKPAQAEKKTTGKKPAARKPRKPQAPKV